VLLAGITSAMLWLGVGDSGGESASRVWLCAFDGMRLCEQLGDWLCLVSRLASATGALNDV